MFRFLPFVPLLLGLLLPSGVQAQPAAAPVPVSQFSGSHSASAQSAGARSRPAFTTRVQVSGAPWMRVSFSDVDLGAASYVLIRSARDGATQRLDARTMAQWGNQSAFFNGDALHVELHVAPGDADVRVTLDQALPGARGHVEAATARQGDVVEVSSGAGCTSGSPLLSMACNGLDERVRTQEPASGRLLYDFGGSGPPQLGGEGTAWITSTGALMSAGHTAGSPAVYLVEFNAPDSAPDGTYIFGPPENQYLIDTSSVLSENSGIGNDWSVFQVFDNSNTALQPAVAQAAYYRLSLDKYQTGHTVEMYGYGKDNAPQGPVTKSNPNGYNNHHHTLQYASGPITEIDTKSFRSTIDHAAGNSGSAMLVNGLAIGIDTHGGNPDGSIVLCRSFSQRLDVADVNTAVDTFWGTDAVYVDPGHPATTTDGTPFYPYASLTQGLSNVPAGGQLHLVEGAYPGAFTIQQDVTFYSKVGTSTLGGNGFLALKGAGTTATAETDALSASAGKDGALAFGLDASRPNPTSGQAVIEFTLAESADVRLVVYDVLGREVARLVDGATEAGRHSATLDAAALSSGVYVYRLTAGAEAAVQQLTVAR